MKVTSAVFFVFLNLTGVVYCLDKKPIPAEILLVDDFDSGAQGTNFLGGERGIWVDKPEAMDSDCVMSFVTKGKRGRQGYSLHLNYTVDTVRYSANGYWTKLKDLDVRRFRWLVLYLKGNPRTKFTKQIRIELKNRTQIGVHEIKGITRRWKKIVIPLNRFSNITKFDKLTELVINFEKGFVTVPLGGLFVDDIYFSAEQQP